MAKKFKIASVLLLSLYVSGVVSASSINGEYKGNPIVKVRVNGNVVDSEVPGIILDGSTVLPLRAVAHSLGADVKWDPDTYTVDLTTKPDQFVKLVAVKYYSSVSNVYSRLLNIDQDLETSEAYNVVAEFNAIHGTDPSGTISNNISIMNTISQKLDRVKSNIDLLQSIATTSIQPSTEYADLITIYNNLRVIITEFGADENSGLNKGLKEIYAAGGTSVSSFSGTDAIIHQAINDVYSKASSGAMQYSGMVLNN